MLKSNYILFATFNENRIMLKSTPQMRFSRATCVTFEHIQRPKYFLKNIILKAEISFLNVILETFEEKNIFF